MLSLLGSRFHFLESDFLLLLVMMVYMSVSILYIYLSAIYIYIFLSIWCQNSYLRVEPQRGSGRVLTNYKSIYLSTVYSSINLSIYRYDSGSPYLQIKLDRGGGRVPASGGRFAAVHSFHNEGVGRLEQWRQLKNI